MKPAAHVPAVMPPVPKPSSPTVVETATGAATAAVAVTPPTTAAPGISSSHAQTRDKGQTNLVLSLTAGTWFFLPSFSFGFIFGGLQGFPVFRSPSPIGQKCEVSQQEIAFLYNFSSFLFQQLWKQGTQDGQEACCPLWVGPLSVGRPGCCEGLLAFGSSVLSPRSERLIYAHCRRVSMKRASVPL
jgi:hypothetical protein